MNDWNDGWKNEWVDERMKNTLKYKKMKKRAQKSIEPKGEVSTLHRRNVYKLSSLLGNSSATITT